MAETLFQFDVDDDSPEIAYFPFVNQEPSSNLTAGWQLLYSGSGASPSPGQVGVGSSFHYTFLDGASFLINWNGTGIDLLGSVSNASYIVSLDGVPSTYSPDPTNTILASINDLANTNHTLLLTTVITNGISPDAFLTFDKARITYAPPPGVVNTTATSSAIADSDIAFLGSWSYVADGTGNAMHVSSSAGDRAETKFIGSAITIYGLTSSYSGNFSVILDNITTNLSAQSSYNNSHTLLFYATDLSQDVVHNITVINQANRTLALQAGGINVTSFGNSTTVVTSPSIRTALPAGTIAAVVLGIVLFLVIAGIICIVFYVRRKARAVNQPTFLESGNRFNDRNDNDIEPATVTSPPYRGELESTSLSTSKGYGFGLGLRRGFRFPWQDKTGSSSSGLSCMVFAEPQPIPQRRGGHPARSVNTLTEKFPVIASAPESEKLAPGWYNPVARPSFKYGRTCKDTHDILLPELHVDRTGPVIDDNDDDADIKTLTSRQDETLAATLSLSPRTTDDLSVINAAMLSKLGVDTHDDTEQSHESLQPEPLQVRDTSPFRVDVSAIFGTRKGSSRDSRTTSGSGSSTWSKVRARLYRKAHRDDGRRSSPPDKQERSSSSGPESVPVVMHESDSPNPPSETAPGSGTYSFLDLASSRASLRRVSKTTLSSTPAEVGHGARETSAWSDNTSIRMVRVERSRDNMAPKPDAPSTASGGSHPSDGSGTRTVPPALATQTQGSFPIPISIPPSSPTVLASESPSDTVPDRHLPPSPPHSPAPNTEQYLQVPHSAPPELSFTSASSPTESVPFSISEIHFRHSFSDYASFDSRRDSASSALPPHPPLPHVDGSQATTPTYTAPPPYIVQRVLGLSTSPLNPLSPASLATSRSAPGLSHSATLPRPSRTSGTSLAQHSPPSRVSSLLGPRPPPSTAGSTRGAAPPQLPMQGRRGSSRGPR